VAVGTRCVAGEGGRESSRRWGEPCVSLVMEPGRSCPPGTGGSASGVWGLQASGCGVARAPSQEQGGERDGDGCPVAGARLEIPGKAAEG